MDAIGRVLLVFQCKRCILKYSWDFINLKGILLPINFSQFIDFKIESYSAFNLTKGDSTNWMFKNRNREDKVFNKGKNWKYFPF